MSPFGCHPPGEVPPGKLTALAEQVERDGGVVLAVYREPVGRHWQAFCLLPLDRVTPTPYQRDRTPNGHHRRTALQKLKAGLVPAILVPEPEVAYQILALNTEKAHNLKEKSLEVIRMYRGLCEEQPRTREEDWTFQFEAAHFITLGLLYEENKRFAGGAFAPILRRVDGFLKGRLPDTLEVRRERAAQVKAADEALARAVAALRKRGINHPYVKNYVLARTSPLTRARKTLPSFEQTLRKLLSGIEGFDASRVRPEDVQRAAVFAAPAGD
jgi:ParB family chromosome partitioning protein